MARLVIYGAGGFGRELVTAARGRDVAFLSDTPVAAFASVAIIRAHEVLPDDEIVIGIANGPTRKRIAAQPLPYGKLIAPTCIIGEDVEIGEGAVFCDNTMVTASACIGRHFHCNIYSYVAHDCEIGDFVTFGPRVCCNGNVHIGDGAYIGAGAVIRQGAPGRPLRIGAGATVGAGAIVLGDVPPGETVVGNPARPMRRSVAA